MEAYKWSHRKYEITEKFSSGNFTNWLSLLQAMEDGQYVSIQCENICAAYAELERRVQIALHQHRGNEAELTIVHDEVLTLAEAVERVWYIHYSHA